MDLIPEDQLQKFGTVQWAPMVDFLFIVLIVFATIAITRTGLFDRDVQLVNVSAKKSEAAEKLSKHFQFINLSVNARGKYKWISERSEYYLDSAHSVKNHLISEQQAGILPQNPSKTKVLLHIDRRAPWEAIAELIYTLREKGFPVHPVYESQTATSPQ